MYNTGELARKAGCKAAAIRYYERLKLLDEPAFVDAGRPRYVNSHLQQLTLILKARSLGFSLEETRELLHVVDQKKNRSSVDIATIIVQINIKISELEIMKELINQICPTQQIAKDKIKSALVEKHTAFL